MLRVRVCLCSSSSVSLVRLLTLCPMPRLLCQSAIRHQYRMRPVSRGEKNVDYQTREADSLRSVNTASTGILPHQTKVRARACVLLRCAPCGAAPVPLCATPTALAMCFAERLDQVNRQPKGKSMSKI